MAKNSFLIVLLVLIGAGVVFITPLFAPNLTGYQTASGTQPPFVLTSSFLFPSSVTDSSAVEEPSYAVGSNSTNYAILTFEGNGSVRCPWSDGVFNLVNGKCRVVANVTGQEFDFRSWIFAGGYFKNDSLSSTYTLGKFAVTGVFVNASELNLNCTGSGCDNSASYYVLTKDKCAYYSSTAKYNSVAWRRRGVCNVANNEVGKICKMSMKLSTCASWDVQNIVVARTDYSNSKPNPAIHWIAVNTTLHPNLINLCTGGPCTCTDSDDTIGSQSDTRRRIKGTKTVKNAAGTEIIIPGADACKDLTYVIERRCLSSTISNLYANRTSNGTMWATTIDEPIGCPGGTTLCFEGACVPSGQTCTDSDNGKYSGPSGFINVTNSTGSYFFRDTCLGSTTVREFSCTGNYSYTAANGSTVTAKAVPEATLMKCSSGATCVNFTTAAGSAGGCNIQAT